MALAKLRAVDAPPASMLTKIKAMVESGIKGVMLDVQITPEIAKMLLRFNAPGFGGTNRKVSGREVRHWASIMRDNQWYNTGEPIILSDDKTLNDGQHRLLAVIEADMSIPMDIRFGVPRAAFISTGVGRSRSGKDALVIHGVLNEIMMAGLLRMVIAYEKGLPNGLRMRARPIEIITAAERYPDTADALNLVRNTHKRGRSAASSALAFFALRTANRATVEGFFGPLRSGYSGAKITAADQYSDAIFSGNGFRSDTDGRIQNLATGIQCWNAYRRNEKVTQAWRPGMPFPLVDDLKL